LAWKENKYTTMTPWSKLDVLTLELLRKILHHSPSSRLPLEKILEHKWCHYQFNDSGELLVFLVEFASESVNAEKAPRRDSTSGQVLSDSQLDFESLRVTLCLVGSCGEFQRN
jgi:serine/threonine-protein kinase CHEK1